MWSKLKIVYVYIETQDEIRDASYNFNNFFLKKDQKKILCNK